MSFLSQEVDPVGHAPRNMHSWYHIRIERCATEGGWKRFNEMVEADKRFTPRHIALLSQSFHVSPEAMCRQLERIELLPSGTFESLKERGFNRDFVRGLIGDPAPRAPRIPLSPRLAQLASSAHRRGLLTEGQLASMLLLDRVEVREILDIFDGGAIDEIQIPVS